MIGRHADEATRAAHRRRIKAIAITDGVVLFAALTAVVWAAAVDNAPSVQADELPQPPEVTEPMQPVAGPVQPIFDFADVTPWDPGKEPGFVVGSVSAERPRTTSRVVRPETVADGSAGFERPPVPPEAPAPTGGDDPLTDDGEFGDGCEQPGTPEQCDPDLTPPVGLPPVVVPGDVEAEQPPIEEPAEEEPPVDEPVVGLPEVVEPETEVAAP